MIAFASANAASNAVIVGPHQSLARRRVDAAGMLYVDVSRAAAKLRYRSPAMAASVSQHTGGFTLELDEQTFTCGQCPFPSEWTSFLVSLAGPNVTMWAKTANASAYSRLYWHGGTTRLLAPTSAMTLFIGQTLEQL